MRGKLDTNCSVVMPNAGSSPHAWETLCVVFQRHASSRFIPTCVGNSSKQKTAIHSLTVHPHMRGKLEIGSPRIFSPSGSSPHAWETPAVAE